MVPCAPSKRTERPSSRARFRSGEVQPAAHVDARAVEVIELGDHGRRIDHHARANDGVFAGTKDSAGDQLQDKAIAIVDDGVARVVAAGAARNVVKGSRHVVDDFAFAFIAPLRADHYDRFHSCWIPFPEPVFGPHSTGEFSESRMTQEASRGLRRNEYRTRRARRKARHGERKQRFCRKKRNPGPYEIEKRIPPPPGLGPRDDCTSEKTNLRGGRRSWRFAPWERRRRSGRRPGRP